MWSWRLFYLGVLLAGGLFFVFFQGYLSFFVLLFLLASIITTVLPIPAAAVSFLKNASKFFIVMAMAAIGLNTDIVKLVKTGGKPIFMGFCCWVAIAGVSLLVQHLLGIW